MSAHAFLPYGPDVETIQPDEAKVASEIAATMRKISAKVGDQFRHTMRPVHAKSHGLIRARLTVDAGLEANLPEPYRQGLFAEAGSYDAILRLSTNPGDILSDSISSPRGWAIKILGPTGLAMLPGHEGERTQDFLCVNGPAFQVPDAAGFLKQLQMLEKHATDSPELKQVVSTTARLTGAALGAVGLESGALKGFGHPETHILGETFYSQTPFRYGGYVAKISFAPASANLKALTGRHLEHAGDYSALRDAVVKFFATERAAWEVRAQLAMAGKETPIEDASVVWPETVSPQVRVGVLTAEPQEAYSAARRVFVDEQLSFSPWHGLAAHQPLGNVNRVRRPAYPDASRYRQAQEGRQRVEPKEIGELPD